LSPPVMLDMTPMSEPTSMLLSAQATPEGHFK